MRMIGGSTRLSMLVIDANKSWEEKQITNVALYPSTNVDSNFNYASVLNMGLPYNGDILLESTTEPFMTGINPIYLKTFELFCSGRYKLQFNVKVADALQAGNVIYRIDGVTKQSWTSLVNTTYVAFNTNINTSITGQFLQIMVYGSSPTATVYIGNTKLYGAAFNKSPTITLE